MEYMRKKVQKLLSQSPVTRKKVLILSAAVFWVLALSPTLANAQILDILMNPLDAAETGIAMLISVVAYAITFILGKLLVGVIVVLVGVLQYNNFINESVVVIGWAIVRDFMNLFFVVALMIIAFATVFRIQAYHYKSMLPKLVIAAIVVNFSKVITGALIDVSQVLMLTFVHSFQAIAAGNMAELFGIDKLLSFGSTFAAIQSGATGLPSIMVSLVLAIILLWVALVVVLIMIVVLVVRIVMLWILTIFSPVAWVAPLLPGGAQYASQWWSELSRHLITGVIMAFLLWLTFASLQIGGALTGEVPDVGDRDKSGVSQGVSSEESEFAFAASEIGTYEGMFTFIVSIVMLIASLGVAQQMGGAAGGVVGKVSNSIIQGNVGAAIKGSQFLGRKADQFQRSVQRRALKGDIPILNRFKATRDAAKWTAGLLTGETRKQRAKDQIQKEQQAAGGAGAVEGLRDGRNLSNVKKEDSLEQAGDKIREAKAERQTQIGKGERNIRELKGQQSKLETLESLYQLREKRKKQKKDLSEEEDDQLTQLEKDTGVSSVDQVATKLEDIHTKTNKQTFFNKEKQMELESIEKQESLVKEKEASIAGQYAYNPTRLEYVFKKMASHGLSLNPEEIKEGIQIMNTRRLRDEKLGLREGIHDAASAVLSFKGPGKFEQKTMQMQADSMLINERKKELSEKTGGETELVLKELNAARQSDNKADMLAALQLLAENVDMNELPKQAKQAAEPLIRDSLRDMEVYVENPDGKGGVRRNLTGKEVEHHIEKWKEGGEVQHAYVHQVLSNTLMKAFDNDEDAAAREGSKLGIAGLMAGNMWLYGNNRYNSTTGSHEMDRMVVRQEADPITGQIEVVLKMPKGTVGAQAGKFRNVNIRRYLANFHPNNLANESVSGKMLGISDFGKAFFLKDLNDTLLDTFKKRAGEMRQDFAKIAESDQFRKELEAMALKAEYDINYQHSAMQEGLLDSPSQGHVQAERIREWISIMDNVYTKIK